MPNFLPDGSVYLTKEEYSVIAQTHLSGEEAKAAVIYATVAINILGEETRTKLRGCYELFDEFEHTARYLLDCVEKWNEVLDAKRSN